MARARLPSPQPWTHRTERIVELKRGRAIDRLKGEGGKWSPLSIKLQGEVVGWLTTFGGIPTLIVSPNRRAKMAPGVGPAADGGSD